MVSSVPGAPLANAGLCVDGALVLARLFLFASLLVARRLAVLDADHRLAHLVLGGVAGQGALVALVVTLVTVADDALGFTRAAVSTSIACHFGAVNTTLLATCVELLYNLEFVGIAWDESVQLVLVSVDADFDHGLGAKLVRVADPLA